MPDGISLPVGFSKEEYARRWAAVRELFEQYGIDALAATNSLHSIYLSGADPKVSLVSPLIMPMTDDPVFVLRLYDEDRTILAGHVTKTAPYFAEDDAVPVWAETLKNLGLADARLGLELDCWDLAPADIERLKALLPKLQIVDASRLVGTVMDVKSDEELDALRVAADLSDIGLQKFYEMLKAGASELDIALAVQECLVRAGSGVPPMGIFLIGEHSVVPHGEPGSRSFQAGDHAITELIGVAGGYCSPICRTALSGSDPEIERYYSAGRQALEAAITASVPGATTGDVDNALRDELDKAGLRATHRYRGGYSVGLGWQKRGNTSLKPGGKVVIQPGMVFHIPVHLYERERFMVMVGDTVHVTANGTEVLGSGNRELVRI